MINEKWEKFKKERSKVIIKYLTTIRKVRMSQVLIKHIVLNSVLEKFKTKTNQILQKRAKYNSAVFMC